jgi:hypothetical protein
MNADKIALRDRVLGREEEMVTRLFHLAFHAESEAAQCAALRDLFDHAFGRPPQPCDGDGQGGPIRVITRVPGPDD